MTEKQRAQKLIRRRIELEAKLSKKAKEELLLMFDQLSWIGYKSTLPPELFRFSDLKNSDDVDKIVTDIVMWLYFNEITYADNTMSSVFDAYGVKSNLRASDFLNAKSFDRTNKQRLRMYADRYKYEIESWIASGLLLGLSRNELRNRFINDSKNPYGNGTFREATKKKSSATRLKTKGKSWGVGQYTSAESLIDRLIRSSVADAFRRAQAESFKNMELIGFNVYRGSSYPCSLCDSNRRFHPLRFAELPPYHANCVCYAVPVYKEKDKDTQ